MYIRCILYIHKYFFRHLFDMKSIDDEDRGFPCLKCFSLDNDSWEDASFLNVNSQFVYPLKPPGIFTYHVIFQYIQLDKPVIIIYFHCNQLR